MFGWEFPPFNSGGLGVACQGLSKALAANGLQVSFVLPYKIPTKAFWCNFVFADEFSTFETNEKLMKALSGYPSHSESGTTISVGEGAYGGILDRVFAYARRAPAIARKIEHSVIHAHDWLTYPSGIAAKRTSNKPLVVHMHATEFDRSGSDNVNESVYNIERAGLEEADAVVAVSERTKNQLIKKYGVPANKVKVVYNGVEWNPHSATSDFGTSETLSKIKREGNSIVLFVGRITLQKGPDYFVSMAEKVLRFEPRTFFVVSGSGDMEGAMIQEVARRGLADHFIFCGFLRDNELVRIYNLADMFVMPSVSEPFGIVPLEAMLSNVPVLVSKESGVSEILSNVFKSHFWDVDDMTDKVVSVLRQKKLVSHLQQNGKAEARTIHWGKAAESLINLYDSLVPAF